MGEAPILSEQSFLDLIAAAYTDDADDVEAAREEASLLRSRRHLLCRASAQLATGEVIELPSPPQVAHIYSPHIVYKEGSPRLPTPVMEEKKPKE